MNRKLFTSSDTRDLGNPVPRCIRRIMPFLDIHMGTRDEMNSLPLHIIESLLHGENQSPRRILQREQYANLENRFVDLVESAWILVNNGQPRRFQLFGQFLLNDRCGENDIRLVSFKCLRIHLHMIPQMRKRLCNIRKIAELINTNNLMCLPYT